MNIILKIFLSMSISGTLLIFILLLAKKVWKDKISRQWQYYIWLIVILRLIFPFAPETNLMKSIYQATQQIQTQDFFATKLQTKLNFIKNKENPSNNRTQDSDKGNDFTETKIAEQPLQNRAPLQEKSYRLGDVFLVLLRGAKWLWIVWIAVAFGMIIRKITIYQSFVNCVKAGLTPVCNIEKLDGLSAAMEQIGIKKSVELGVNPLVSSPMLIGFFQPCIVLPNANISEKDFHYIMLHELIHFKRRDILYKWLMQFTVCLHWFNPMVYLMRREIIQACEFSCDEAVLEIVGELYASDYGKALLDAMSAIGKYKESFGVVTFNQNKQLLRERLCAIVNFRKKSKRIAAVTGVLTLSILFGTVFIGVYPVVAAQSDVPQQNFIPQNNFFQNFQEDNIPENKYWSNSALETNFQESNIPNSKLQKDNASKTDFLGRNLFQENHSERADINALSSQINQYYDMGSVPLFQIAFAQLKNAEQEEWLERIYIDGQIQFFGAAVDQLEMDGAVIQRLAEKTYTDHAVSYFSIVAKKMSEKTLRAWLDRALTDQLTAFQAVLFALLEEDDKWNALEEALEKQYTEKQIQEYLEHGILSDGKNYYYESQLVNVFLDIRTDSSFYTLQINPRGTIHIQVTRNENGEIESVDYMSDAEVETLLSDMKDEDDFYEDMG